ncbi:MAG: tetratricopeptide repeat protein [Myxococcota bacterium]
MWVAPASASVVTARRQWRHALATRVAGITMSAEELRTALDRIHDNPFDESAWTIVEEIVTGSGGDDIERSLEFARMGQEQARNWPVVARLLELEIAVDDDDDIAIAKQLELGRIHRDELFDDGSALVAYQGVLERRADDARAAHQKDDIIAAQAMAEDERDEALVEALDTDDDEVKGRMLARAAELTFRHLGRDGEARDKAMGYLAQALTSSPAPPPRLRLAAAMYRHWASWPELVAVLKQLAGTAADNADRLAASSQLLAVARYQLGDTATAVDAATALVDLAPGHPAAMSLLVAYYTEAEAWDHLAALYEDQLRSGAVAKDEELGMWVQLAMLNWKTRERPDAALPYFEKVRRVDATHAGMLAFFRAYCRERGDAAKLMGILTDAQRALDDEEAQTKLAEEIASLAEGQENARRAIEQYKSILRADPDHTEARDKLKQLYLETESFNALVEILRQELTRIPEDAPEAKVLVLREIADIYRDRMESDTALLTVLTQILQLADDDIAAVRELVQVYESLGRWRDLLQSQQRLAALTENQAEKESLLRSVARRWLDQFSNVQNAIGAYEALLEVVPGDSEAKEKLRELYKKRRAWDKLYDLYDAEVDDLEGDARVALMVEMAKLAAERLNKGTEAIRLFKEVLVFDPGAEGVLDQLERQAERQKDYATVAHVLERRIEAADDVKSQLALLQKLGVLYSDKVEDREKSNEAWRRVLELSPGHKRALRVLRQAYVDAEDWDGLQDLYLQQEDFEGLADFLSTTADRTDDAGIKVALSFRAARVYEDQIGTPERAARSYERILAAEKGNVEAAERLLPIYEEEEKWPRLPALYDVILGATDDVATQIELLEKVANITGGPLSNKSAALGYARRAYELRPDPEGLERLRTWSQQAGEWDAFTAVVEGRLERGDEAEARGLKLMLAEVYAGEAERTDEAVAIYRTLLEEDPSDRETMAVFESLLRATDRRDDLRWLFERKVSLAEGPERYETLEAWAAVEEEAFAEPARAIALLRRVVDDAPRRTGALGSLTRLLRAGDEHEAAAEVMKMHRDASEGDDRLALETALAELYEGQLGRPEAAYEACVRALEIAPDHAPTVHLLEQLLEQPSTRVRAARTLERIYADRGEAEKRVLALRAMLDVEEDEETRQRLARQLAEVHERELDEPGVAFDVVRSAIRESPLDVEQWERLGELGHASGRHADLAEAYATHLDGGADDDGDEANEPEGLPDELALTLAARAAALHEEHLGDPEGAIPYLEQCLTIDPQDAAAFDRLKAILNAVERWDDLQALYDRTIGVVEADSDKTELLHQAAVVAEDMVGDDPRAIGYYERIVALDGLHQPANDALERLYGREERYADLAALLERKLETAIDDEVPETQQRLVELYLHRLQQTERVMGHLEAVLAAREDDLDARALAEECLDVPALRQPAAALLDTVYLAVDDPRDLVRVLKIRLEGADDDDDKRGLLRRIATLQDERLRDDEGALATLRELLPLEPDDDGVRDRLLDVGRRLGDHAALAATLLAAASSSELVATRGSLLMEAASIHRDQLDAPGKAIEIFSEVLGIEPDDPELVIPAARELAELHQERGDHQALARVLATEVRLTDEPEAKKELYARIANIHEDLLENDVEAVAAWQARVEDDASDATALRALERLYARTERHGELVETLRQLESIAEDGDERRRCMVGAAEVLGGELGQTTDAIAAWRSVLDDFGPDRDTLSALARLYDGAERWDDLAEIYETWLGVSEEASEQIELLASLGDVRRVHLDDPNGALSAYRDVLTREPDQAAAREALEQMLDHGEPDVRREAAETLAPLYDADGEAEKLLRVLDIEVDATFEPARKLDTLERALQTAEDTLESPERAYAYAARGVKEAAGDTSLSFWVETAERLAAATDRQASLLALYEEVVPEVLEAEVQQRLRLRAGELARDRIEDPARAVGHYRAALDAQADDQRAMVALEGLYADTGDNAALLEVLQLRADAVAGDAERSELLFRVAELRAGPLSAEDEAIRTYEEILDLEFDTRAVEALEKLYRSSSRYDDMVRLYERQLDAAEEYDTPDIRVKMARVVGAHLGDGPRALDELAEALRVDPDHAEAIEWLEGRLQQDDDDDTDHRARVAEMLEPVYLSRHDWKRLEGVLEARLETTHDPGARAELLSRLSTLYEEQLEDYASALDMVARQLDDDPGNEDIWAEVERLGRVLGEGSEGRVAGIFARALDKVAADEPQTAKLAARTGALYAEVGENELALAWYRRAYRFEPESDELFRAIDEVLIRLSSEEGRAHEGGYRTEASEEEFDGDRRAERIQHYRHALDNVFDDERRVSHLHVVTELQRSLGREDDAIATLNELLDIDAENEAALDGLTELYAAEERHQDLADLYERRAEMAPSSEVAAPYRLELARLLGRDRDARDRALDQLEAIVQDGPEHPEAVAELEKLLEDDAHKQRVVDILRPLYQRQDDWRGLIRLNDERLALVAYPVDQVEILADSAALWEDRGQDEEKAFEITRRALLLAPDHEPTRSNLERLAEELDAWGDLASTYDEAASSVADEYVKRQLLESLSHICDEQLDDPRRALDALGKLSALDPSEPEPLEKMDTLAMLLSDWETLVGVLRRKAENATSDEERASTLRRLGSIRGDMLEDPDAAVRVYEEALEVMPSDLETLDALLDLYRPGDDAERLVALLEQRVEYAELDEDALRHRLLLEAAEVYRARLDRPDEAVRVLTAALDARPGDVDVLRSLEALYEARERHDELLENLKTQVEYAEDAERRRALRNKIGDLYLRQYDNAHDALDQYRAVLDEGDDDPHALARVRDIGEKYEELRLDVSALLEPLLQAAGAHQALVEVMELRFSGQTDPEERAQTLSGMALIQEEQLDRPGDAQATVLRALSETPDDEALHRELERLSELADQWRPYADALEARAGEIFDAVVQTDLYRRLGTIAEERLDAPERAIEAYRRASEQAEEPSGILVALDRLYVATEGWEALGDVLERRAELETEGATRAELLHRLGALQVDRFEQLDRGLATLRQAADLDPEHAGVIAQLERLTEEEHLFEEAAEALDGMYRVAGDAKARARLRNKRISYAPNGAERVRLRLDLAQMLEDETDDTVAAQEVIQEAIHDDPSDPELLPQLERLAATNAAADPDAWRRAADAVGSALTRSLEAEEAGAGDGNVTPELSRDLYLRTAGWYREHLDDDETAAARLTQALEQDPGCVDALTALEEIQRDQGATRALVDSLRRLAELSDAGGGVDRSSSDLRREAKGLADELEEHDLAEQILRDMLAVDDADVWALTELCEVCARKNAYDELLGHLRRRIELMPEPDALRGLRHRAAEIAAEHLDDPETARDFYEQAFEDDPQDEVASSGLRELYAKLERFDDMLRFTERLVDLADEPARRAELRLECARLCIEKLDAPSEGIEHLNAIIEEMPTFAGAVSMLAEMLEREGRDDELAEFLQRQIDVCREEGAQEQELGHRVKLAELYETRLNDPEKAIEGYVAVLDTDEAFRPALAALARLYEAQGDIERAAETHERLLEGAADEERGPLALKSRDLYVAAKAPERAIAVLERALAAGSQDAVGGDGDEVVAQMREGLKGLYRETERWSELADATVAEAERSARTEEKVHGLREAAEIRAERLEDHATAAELFERALAIEPDDRELMLRLCDAYTASGRSDEAIEVLGRVVASYGGRRSKELGAIHRRIAKAHLARGDREAALTELEAARKMDPGSIEVLFALGSLSIDLAEGAEDARDHYKRAGNAFRSLLLQQLGADAPVTKADVFYHLALVSQGEGDLKKARQNAERALSNDREHERAQALVEELAADA